MGDLHSCFQCGVLRMCAGVQSNIDTSYHGYVEVCVGIIYKWETHNDGAGRIFEYTRQ